MTGYQDAKHKYIENVYFDLSSGRKKNTNYRQLAKNFWIHIVSYLILPVDNQLIGSFYESKNVIPLIILEIIDAPDVIVT